MLLSLAYIFLLGLTLAHIFSLMRLPQLIGYLVTGIVLGPYMLDLISGDILEISAPLRQVALVVILMRAGLALDIDSLKRAGRPAVLLCFVPAVFEIVGVILLAPPLLGLTVLESAILGSVIAAVSPAVIVPKMLMLIENKAGQRRGIPQMIMAGASMDDIFVLVLFTTFTTMGQGGEVGLSVIGEVPISVLTGLVAGVAGGWLLVKLFRCIHLRDTAKMLIILGVSFLLLALEEQLKGVVPFSALLAVIAMGAAILMFYPVLAKRLSPKFNKVWVGAEIMLFVLVGSMVDLEFAVSAGFAPLWLLLGVLAFRMAGVYASMLGTKLNPRERLFCMIAYIPKATVQAAIGAIPLSMGLPCGEIVLTVALISILVTAPLGAIGIDFSYKKLLR